MTAIEEKAQRYDKRQRGIELKKRVATLGDKLQDYGRVWQKLAPTFRDYDYPNRFVIEADNDGSCEI